MENPAGYKFHVFEIPSHMVEGLLKYVNNNIQPGDFLIAVLENDLMQAVSRADMYNIRNLPAYCAWLHNEAPPDCYGSPKKVKAWLARSFNHE